MTKRNRWRRVLRCWIENSVDVPGGPHDAVTDQCDPADQNVADLSFVEVFEDAAETSYR
jgi:hypothetical protein